MILNMLGPKFPGHKSGRAADKGSGDYISEKMPVPHYEGHCPHAKQNDEDGLRTRLKPNHHHRERRGHHHMTRGKAAVAITMEETE